MRGSYNLLVDVKMIENVGGPSCWIIAKNFFRNFQNNQVNYTNLPNHDNLSRIWRYYLNLVYFALDKL
jgi:hypothetical protein